MTHKWKIGDWAVGEHSKKRWFIISCGDGDVGVGVSREDGYAATGISLSNLRHLPGCDSWDWKPTPTLQIREGAYYLTAEGQVRGPAFPRSGEQGCADAKWNVDGWWYYGDGRHVAFRGHDLVREVEAPAPKIKPPKGYRLLDRSERVEVGDICIDRNKTDWRDAGGKSIGCDAGWRIDSYGVEAFARKIEPKYRPFANAAEFAPHRDKWIVRKDGKPGAHRSGTYGDSGSIFSFERMFDSFMFEDGTPCGVLETSE